MGETEKVKDPPTAYLEGNKCPQCGFDMVDLSACHFRCHNCGAERTCSDI